MSFSTKPRNFRLGLSIRLALLGAAVAVLFTDYYPLAAWLIVTSCALNVISFWMIERSRPRAPANESQAAISIEPL